MIDKLFMLTNISTTISPDLLKSIDEARGEIPRSRFITRILERSLKNKRISVVDSKKSVPVGNGSKATNQQ